MKRFVSFLMAALMLIAVSACKMSTEQLAEEVKNSMNETWEKQGIEITCKSVGLVHKEGNTYTGVAKVEDEDDTAELGIEVTYDGENLKWEITDLLNAEI